MLLRFCLPAIAGANHTDIDRKVYLPHLTGTATGWQDSLVANNKGPQQQTFTLYAIGSNRQVLDSTVVSLSRYSRIVGFHTEWFPNINLDDIAALVVRSSEARVAGVNDPFTIVPAEADLNRLYTYNENWDDVRRYNGTNSGQALIETLVQGPVYVVVPAGAFEDVIKLTLREQSNFSYYRGGSALIHETIKFWLDKDFGIVKMSINDFEFEIEGVEDGN